MQSCKKPVEENRIFPEIPHPVPKGVTAERLQKTQSMILKEGIFSQAVATLTTGVFLVGLALQFKAPNFIIGVLAAIPALVQLFQIPSIYLVEKTDSRRKMTVLATLLSRFCLLPITITPFLPSALLALTILVLSFICHSALGAIAGCSWNSWMKDTIPSQALGTFFSKKMIVATLTSILLTMLGGYFIDSWSHHFSHLKAFGYAIPFGIAWFIGMMGLSPLKRIPEAKRKVPAPRLGTPSLWSMLKEPVADRNYRQLMIFMSAWNFAINLAAPFFTVYMLTMLNLPMAWVTVFTILSQVAHLFFLRIWGKLTDRFSNKSVLLICAPLFLFCILGWTFTPYHQGLGPTIPWVLAINLLIGVATAGVNLANGNIAMKLAPEGKGTAYIAANTIIASLAAGIAPMLGGLFADFFAHQEFSVVLEWHAPGSALALKTLDFQYWDFFFFFAFILGLISISRLRAVHEKGCVQKTVVLREFVVETKQTLRQLSRVSNLIV